MSRSMVYFTPKKFIDAIELSGLKLSMLINAGLDRSYFIPRYKQGAKRKKELEYSYRKGLRFSTIQKIAKVLVKKGYSKELTEEQVIMCFINDNFEDMLPAELL